MMSITHAAIALAATSIALGISDPMPLALAVVGSQLPDLDTTESLAGRVVFPIAWAIEQRFPHRTITHSFQHRDCGDSGSTVVGVRLAILGSGGDGAVCRLVC